LASGRVHGVRLGGGFVLAATAVEEYSNGGDDEENAGLCGFGEAVGCVLGGEDGGGNMCHAADGFGTLLRPSCRRHCPVAGEIIIILFLLLSSQETLPEVKEFSMVGS
jgi:hypothetical protein